MSETVETVQGEDLMASVSPFALRVINSKGGTGKSTVFINLFEHLVELGIVPAVVDIDTERKSSAFVRRHDFVKLIELEGLTTSEEADADRDAIHGAYDPAAETWLGESTMTDVGAAIPKTLFSYERQSGMVEGYDDVGIRVINVIVVSGDKKALEAGIKDLVTLIDMYGEDAKYFVVFNDATGKGFGEVESGPAVEKLKGLERQGILKVLRVPHCDSKLVTYGNLHDMTPFEVRDRVDEIADALELILPKKNRERSRLTKFLADFTEALKPVVDCVVGKAA